MNGIINIDYDARTGSDTEHLLQPHLDRFKVTKFIFETWHQNCFEYRSECGKYKFQVIRPDNYDILTSTMTIQDFCNLESDVVCYFTVYGDDFDEIKH